MSQGSRSGLDAAHQPSLYMRAAPEHLEVLRGVPLGALGVVEGVQEAGAVHRLLLDPVDRLGLGDAGRFEDGRADVDAVRELAAHGRVCALIAAGHATTIGLRVPPRWLAICLPHWNGVFMACAQAAAQCGAVWSPPSASMPPYLLDQRQLLVGVEHEAVQEGHLVERAGDRPLQARAVVAPDVEDQRVVEVAHLLDRSRAVARRSSRRSPGSRRRPPSGGRRASSAASSSESHAGKTSGPLGELGVLPGRPRAPSAGRRSPREARPSLRRTCPCTCPPTPSRRGAARARSRSSSTASTASSRPARARACSHSTALSVRSSGK